jgi:hypothetical protein
VPLFMKPSAASSSYILPLTSEHSSSYTHAISTNIIHTYTKHVKLKFCIFCLCVKINDIWASHSLKIQELCNFLRTATTSSWDQNSPQRSHTAVTYFSKVGFYTRHQIHT